MEALTILLILLFLFLTGLSVLVLYSCQQGDAGKIITVKGPIAPSALGTVLTHEHILVDFIGADGTGYHRWNKDTVLRVMLPYLEECKARDNLFIPEAIFSLSGRTAAKLMASVSTPASFRQN